MQETTIDSLRRQFGYNKEIPKRYESEILVALSHYPDLTAVKINFMLAVHAAVPYGTKPAFTSCFKPRFRRTYTITILETAELPESEALFKNLTPRMRLGVLGHELGHIRQYESCNPIGLVKTLLAFGLKKFRRKLERGADKTAIKRGLGEELLEHALYIRTIPGYMKKRPDLNRDYLLPEEIKYYIEHPEEIKAA